MSETNDLVKKSLELLSSQIGVEEDDILPEYSFSDDLHMSPVSLTDFIESLSDLGIDTSSLDMADVETVGDFIEYLESTQPIE